MWGVAQPDTPVLAHGSRPSPTRRPGPLRKSSGDPPRSSQGSQGAPHPQPRARRWMVRGLAVGTSGNLRTGARGPCAHISLQPVQLRLRHKQVRGQQCPAPLGAVPRACGERLPGHSPRRMSHHPDTPAGGQGQAGSGRLGGGGARRRHRTPSQGAAPWWPSSCSGHKPAGDSVALGPALPRRLSQLYPSGHTLRQD